MNFKSKINKLTLFVLVLIVISAILMSPVQNGLCGETDVSCGGILGDSIGIPLFAFSLAIFVLLIILRWLPESVFRSWWRFSKYYFIPTVILIGIMPITSDSMIGPDREIMTWSMAILYSIISLILILYKSFKKDSTLSN